MAENPCVNLCEKNFQNLLKLAKIGENIELQKPMKSNNYFNSGG